MKKPERTDRGVEKRRPWQHMKSERLTSVSLSFSLSLSISLSVVSLTRIQQTTHKLSFHNRLRQVRWPHTAQDIIFDFKPQWLATAEVWMKSLYNIKTDLSPILLWQTHHITAPPHTLLTNIFLLSVFWLFELLSIFTFEIISCFLSLHLLPHPLLHREAVTVKTLTHFRNLNILCIKTTTDPLQPWWASVLYVGNLFILVSGIWGLEGSIFNMLKTD